MKRSRRQFLHLAAGALSRPHRKFGTPSTRSAAHGLTPLRRHISCNVERGGGSRQPRMNSMTARRCSEIGAT
jgi:hypothetical protein